MLRSTDPGSGGGGFLSRRPFRRFSTKSTQRSGMVVCEPEPGPSPLFARHANLIKQLTFPTMWRERACEYNGHANGRSQISRRVKRVFVEILRENVFRIFLTFIWYLY